MQSDIPAAATPSGPFSRHSAPHLPTIAPLEIKLPVNLGDNLLGTLEVFFGDQNKASVLVTPIGMGNRFLWFARMHEIYARSRQGLDVFAK
ncbi:MAG: hypothetical protein E8D46_03780 [Nitrospira sp.]|nr:MAG: hypothetical protein E8D46_03780 [Nitrospira sp.]